MLTPWKRAGRIFLWSGFLFALFVSVIPIGKTMKQSLENRFPVLLELPENVDGILVLGGVVNETITHHRGQVSIGGSIERLTEAANLLKRYPDAKFVFSGGSGKLLTQNIKEADVIAPLLKTLGIDPGRVIFENMARNTYENVMLMKKLLQPEPGESWILVTSAFHMPRSVGTFRKAGWKVIPYPVDFHFTGKEEFRPTFSFLGGFGHLSGGLHEWLGLLFYWLTGKSETFFPEP